MQIPSPPTGRSPPRSTSNPKPVGQRVPPTTTESRRTRPGQNGPPQARIADSPQSGQCHTRLAQRRRVGPSQRAPVCRGVPLLLITARQPNSAGRSRVFPESYPASRCTVIRSGRPTPNRTRHSRVGRRSGESCGLAGATTSPSGLPTASVSANAWRLFAPAHGGLPRGLPAAGGPHDAPPTITSPSCSPTIRP